MNQSSPTKASGANARAPISTERAIDTGVVCSSCGASLPGDARFCPFDGSDLVVWGQAIRPRDSLVGLVIDERYEVLQLLGEGGMGCVYRVRHRVLGRLFALKALRIELARDLVTAERFVQEARAAAAICHPNIVTINDFGMLETGQPYFVMELLEGRTLNSLLRERGQLSPYEAVAVAEQVASALGAAHAAGIIHRDLKPDNVVMLNSSAAITQLKVLDFGLAMVHGNSRLTRDGVVFGTPQYMSPEQATGEPLDAGVDIYSLGIVLYEMLTGRAPFEADTYMGVLTQQLYAEPVPPSRINPELVAYPELEQLVLCCLSKQRSQRYASMQDLSIALRAVSCGGERAGLTDSMRPKVASVRPPMDSRIRRRRRHYRLWAYTVIGAIALVVALALLYCHLVMAAEAKPTGPGGALPAQSADLRKPVIAANASVPNQTQGNGRVDALLHARDVDPTTNLDAPSEAPLPREPSKKSHKNALTGRSGGRGAGDLALRRGAESAAPRENSNELGKLGSSEIEDPWAQ